MPRQPDGKDRTIRLLLPCPPANGARTWGDYYFGHSLGDAFGRLGYHVRYSYSHKGRRARLTEYIARRARPREIEIVIRGRKAWKPIRGKPAVMWVISQSATIDARELADYAHVFVASPMFLERVKRDCRSSSLLYQCTDRERFRPGNAPGHGAVFVGNCRKRSNRPAVPRAIGAGIPLQVWGRNWDHNIPAANWIARHIENQDLAERYRKARVVFERPYERHVDRWLCLKSRL